MQEQIEMLNYQKEIWKAKIFNLQCQKFLEPYLKFNMILIPNFLSIACAKLGYIVLVDRISIVVSATGVVYHNKFQDELEIRDYENFYVSQIQFPSKFIDDSGKSSPTIEIKAFDDWSKQNNPNIYFLTCQDETLINYKALSVVSDNLGQKYYKKLLNSVEYDDENGHGKGEYSDRAVLMMKIS